VHSIISLSVSKEVVNGNYKLCGEKFDGAAGQRRGMGS
jgi:hypothetical protein